MQRLLEQFTRERLENLASGNAFTCIQDDEAALLAQIALAAMNGKYPVIPDGWKLSPENPTQRMLAAGYQAYMKGPHSGRFYRTYLAMLSSAPQPQSEQQNIPNYIPE